MRVDGSTLSSLVAQASALTERQAEISRELSSGTRLGTLSNDPLAAADSVRLSSQIAGTSANLRAVQTAQARMQAADSSLASVVQQLTSAVSLTVAGASGTLNAADRGVLATQLNSIRDTVVNLANSSYNGAALFAGTSSTAVAFSQDATTHTVTYNGDDHASALVVNGSPVQTSLAGSQSFGTGSGSVFATLADAEATLQAGGALSDAQVTAVRASLQTVIDQRSLLASGTARLGDVAMYLSTQSAELQVQQTTLAASDPVALATALSASQTQRTALLSSLATLGKGSLFDYL